MITKSILSRLQIATDNGSYRRRVSRPGPGGDGARLVICGGFYNWPPLTGNLYTRVTRSKVQTLGTEPGAYVDRRKDLQGEEEIPRIGQIPEPKCLN
jgi:hypothetical protein